MMSVAKPSDRGQVLVNTRESIIEVVLLNVKSVGNCSGRTQLLFNIRLSTKEKNLCDDYRKGISQSAGWREVLALKLGQNYCYKEISDILQIIHYVLPIVSEQEA